MKVLALIVATLAVATFGNVCPLGYPGKFSCLNVTFKELVEAPLKFDGVSVCVKGVAASITGIPTYSGKQSLNTQPYFNNIFIQKCT